MSSTRFIGLFGGTFDPIHNGHIHGVESLIDELAFDRIYFLPNRIPPHRDPARAEPEHRLKMVELAVANNPRLIVDARECNRIGTSYTIDTLKEFRSQYPDDSLAFIAGMDAYLDMPNWKSSRSYLDYVHIVVMRRPGYTHDESWGSQFVTHSIEKLNNKRQGYIFFAKSTKVDISSTAMRNILKTQADMSKYLPESVIHYIKHNQLYDATRTT